MATSPKCTSAMRRQKNIGFDENTLFLINKDGIPLSNETWSRMWNFAQWSYPGEKATLDQLKSSTIADKDVPFPQVPMNLMLYPITSRVEMVQNYMRELEYNHTGTQLFDIKKHRRLSGLMDVAREMISSSLPIKCLEAVILGIHLTNGHTGLERFTLSFKSKFNDQTHRHVVLGVYYDGCYGAIGMSRREELMYKPLVFKTLTHLVQDFKLSYEKFWHKLQRMKIGMSITHDPHSFESIPWKGLQLQFKSKGIDEDMEKSIEKHARQLRNQRLSYSTGSSLPAMLKTPNNDTRSSPQKELSNSISGVVQASSSPTLSKRKKKDNFQLRI